MIRLIAAIDQKRGIAKNDGMPWDLPDDEAYFTEQTKKFGGHVLTGGKTFRVAYKNKPLSGRHNYILTREQTPIEGVSLVHNLKDFLKGFKDKDLWVAGGANVFDQIIKLGLADELYLTLIDSDFECDQFFPEYKSKFHLTNQSEAQSHNGVSYKYTIFSKN